MVNTVHLVRQFWCIEHVLHMALWSCVATDVSEKFTASICRELNAISNNTAPHIPAVSLCIKYKRTEQRFFFVLKKRIAGLHPQSTPSLLHDIVRRESHKPNRSPTSVPWLQPLRKQTNTDTSTAPTAETRWPTRTRLRALSPLVTSAWTP